MIKINSYNLLLIVLFQLNTVCGQLKQKGLPDIKNYTQFDYNGGTQNWEIAQDPNGTLYFANNEGLLQFDGTTWRNYQLPSKDLIRSFKIDTNGIIYVGGYNEFGFFKPNKKGKLIYHSLSHYIKKELKANIENVWKIHLFKGGVIFQTFEAMYFYSNNKIQTIKAPNRFQFSFFVNNKLYLQDVTLGILEFRNNRLIPLPGTTALNTFEIWGILPLSPGKLLITTINNGAYLYSNSKLEPWNTEVNTFIKTNSCLGISFIQNEFIAFNTVLNGIVISDKSGRIVQHINQKKGLQNNTVLTSFVDRKNNLWLGLDNGITYINSNSPFSYFGFSYDISTVYASAFHNGNLYVATNRGVFYHKYDDKFSDKPFELVTGTTGQSWNIQVFDNQLVCGNNNGAMIINENRVTKVLDNKGYYHFKKVPGKDGYLIGANYNGFALFENKTGSWIYKNQIEGFDNSINAFQIDEAYIWCIKNNQIYQLGLSDDLTHFRKIKIYKNLIKTQEGPISIHNLDRKVYFQTNNHFYRYSKDQDIFYEDKKMTSVFSKTPPFNQLQQDQIGNIWYTYGKALGVLKKQSNHTYSNDISTFSNLTGKLVAGNISINTLDNNNVFIGLTNGLAHFNFKKSSNYANAPIAHIRNFISQSDTLLLGNGQTTNEKCNLSYDSNHVSFSFASPTYENLDNVQYSYKLDGFDENWSPWSKIYTKEYTNLHEGTYTMQVKVRNSYGIESKESAIDFTVSPPWYRHILAYVFYFIIAILLAVYNQKRTDSKIRKNKYYETLEQRKIYLEKETKIKNEQLELEKEIEKLKNDKLQIKLLTKDKELVNNSLQVVKKNKVLNGIIHKLKEINATTTDETAKTQFSKLQRSITKEVQSDKSWKDLEKHIKNVHFDFLKRLQEKHPSVTPRELDLATYLLLNMSTKEIAEIMNISTGGVDLSRHRLRKKFNLSKKENLVGFLLTI